MKAGVAVRKERRNSPIGLDRLKVQLLVLLEINKSEVGRYLPKTPLNRHSKRAHFSIELGLEGGQGGPLEGHLESRIAVRVPAVAEEVEENTENYAELQNSIKKPRFTEHPLVVRSSFVWPMHLDENPVWCQEPLVVVAVLALVPTELGLLSSTCITIDIGAAKMTEGAVEKSPAVVERAALVSHRRSKHRHQGG